MDCQTQPRASQRGTQMTHAHFPIYRQLVFLFLLQKLKNLSNFDPFFRVRSRLLSTRVSTLKKEKGRLGRAVAFPLSTVTTTPTFRRRLTPRVLPASLLLRCQAKHRQSHTQARSYRIPKEQSQSSQHLTDPTSHAPNSACLLFAQRQCVPWVPAPTHPSSVIQPKV